ncbi:uncharacterized protein GGS22DRAFT_106736 [Annulohypoxylon maeteangense]|uniref:uncharacterized protein n=1 Tax=Annulohypoxylon maeteangense TaxID=1927788 RepID=UPI0020081BF7|nr:uncharacterized protein GGS22DRAFT_106736 [Annulohypoxylon maeteangense]KAI0887251.1 hypothetical protein GGS22DRAFT_106736 [Annulohypoxylon maeteangense]
MSLSKQRISSPLEAGPSILDAYNLPSHLTGALEYASKRLARKALHITLVVVRKEYQLPTVIPPCPTPTSPPLTPSPTRFASPVAGLRQLVRRGTSGSTSSLSSVASNSTASTSSSTSLPTLTETLPISPRRWAIPLTPGSPMTPATPSSIVTASSASSISQGPNEFGLRLIYTGLLSPKAEKTLRTTIQKAERKFRIGTGWLPPATTASACGLNLDLVRRSLLQNEVLFSSEGLILLGLDRLYTFKAALSAYSRSRFTSGTSSPLASPSPTPKIADTSRIEDAVDSLRRLVLANGGRPVSKADLYRSYDWLGVNARALRDVEGMYRRAYGGIDRVGAFEITPEEREREARPVVMIGAPPPPKTPPKTQTTPVLKLDTRLATATTTRIFKPKAKSITHATSQTQIQIHTQPQADEKQGPSVTELEIKLDNLAVEDPDKDGEPEEEEHTARPIRGLPFWNGASIDEMMLSPCDNASVRQSQTLGPQTPNGYDDISPITRGEWGFLFKGEGWKQGKTAVVETC